MHFEYLPLQHFKTCTLNHKFCSLNVLLKRTYVLLCKNTISGAVSCDCHVILAGTPGSQFFTSLQSLDFKSKLIKV